MRETFTRDGFVIARGLLEGAEIARLRAALLDHFSRQWEPEGLGCHQPRAALEIPSIGWIFSHPGIAATVKELTGSPTPVFTTNCDAHMNMLSWWHKDTGEGLVVALKGIISTVIPCGFAGPVFTCRITRQTATGCMCGPAPITQRI